MNRKSTQTQDHGFADSHQRELLRLLRLFGHNHNPERVFSDFVELSALAISNSVDPAQFDVREKRYLDIVGKYHNEEVERFAQMLGELTLSFEHRTSGGLGNMNLTDVLGETFMMLECGNARAGQFFTPFSVSKLMALITIGNADGAIAENGFTRVQEPACGAGGMVVAMAEALGDAGYNFQETMHATCIDIDIRCVHMAYIQLSLLGIPAVVVHGNALSLEVWSVWQTPFHVLGGWNAKLRRGYTLASLERRAVADAGDLIANVSPAHAADRSEEKAASAVTCEDNVADVACLADLLRWRSWNLASRASSTRSTSCCFSEVTVTEDLKDALARASRRSAFVELVWDMSAKNTGARAYVAGVLDALRFSHSIGLETYSALYEQIV